MDTTLLTRDWRIAPETFVRILALLERGDRPQDPSWIDRVLVADAPGLSPGIRVLDLGAGLHMPLARALASHGARVWAIDPRLGGPDLRHVARDERGVVRVPTTIEAFAASRSGREAGERFDAAVGRLFLGFPIRAPLKRSLFGLWAAGPRRTPPPSQAEVERAAATREAEVSSALGTLLRPGAWALLHSLEHESYSDPAPALEIVKPMRPRRSGEGTPRDAREHLARQLDGLWILRRR